MSTLFDPIFDTLDGILVWLSTSLGQFAESYCLLETAESRTNLIAKDGSLISIIRVQGATFLVGPEEFDRLHTGITHSFQTSLSREGHALQVFFSHDKDNVTKELENILTPARQTARQLNLDVDDLLNERVAELRRYCASESIYFVLWTRPNSMTKAQAEQSNKSQQKRLKDAKISPLQNTQNILNSIPEIRETHDSFVRVTLSDLNGLGILSDVLDVHESCHAIRRINDPEFTDLSWKPFLPGDKLPIRETKNFKGDISEVLWPSLQGQLIPRDGENLDLRTARIGDRIYASVFIDLFPKELAPFTTLFNRALQAKAPWRISFMIESKGLSALGLKPVLASILSFASRQNRLIADAAELLNQIQVNTDNAVVKLRVSAATWAKEGETALLRSRLGRIS